MVPGKIRAHLEKVYGVYGGPTKVLRQVKITSWITSEVARRKKACKARALSEISVGAVESPDPVSSNGAPLDQPTCGVLAPTRVVKKAKKAKRRVKPIGAIPQVTEPRLPVSMPQVTIPISAPACVSEVVNKRGRSGGFEYECRWVGVAADFTTWECADSLSALSIAAVQRFDERCRQVDSASVKFNQFAEPIRTQCCNTWVELTAYNEASGKCIVC